VALALGAVLTGLDQERGPVGGGQAFHQRPGGVLVACQDGSGLGLQAVQGFPDQLGPGTQVPVLRESGPGVCQQRVQGAFLGHRPNGVEGQDVGGALPDGEDLGVPEQPGGVEVLDVAVPTEELHGLAGGPDGEPARDQFGDRGEHPQHLPVPVVAPAVDAVQVPDRLQHQRGVGLQFHGEPGQVLHGQRVAGHR
jgi:hypothetical protein